MFPTAPATAKSSNWLHRLRTSKGFPDTDDIDFEHFLTTLNNNDPQTCTDKIPQPNHNLVSEKPDDSESVQNVLSELFQMGEFNSISRINRKKSRRKKPSPRKCVVEKSSDTVPSLAPLRLPVTLSSRRKVKEVNRELTVVECAGEDEDEEEKGDWDVSGYSQTEVTVIDTSVLSWKFDKMLYRRKNVWKVGDKKGKGLMNGNVHKKKLKVCSSLAKSRDEEEVCEKKKKKKKLKLCNSLEYVDKEDAVVRSKSVLGHGQGKTMVAAYEKKQDNGTQIQEKSVFKKKVDGGSSVVLIKSIPTTNKQDVSGIFKSCVKSMQK